MDSAMGQPHMPAEPLDGAPVGEGLAAAANELGQIAICAEGLQFALSPLMTAGGAGVEAFQALDELTQRLHGLQIFLTSMSKASAAAWRLDLSAAADGLPLQAQKQRLTSTVLTSTAAGSPVAAEPEFW